MVTDEFEVYVSGSVASNILSAGSTGELAVRLTPIVIVVVCFGAPYSDLS